MDPSSPHHEAEPDEAITTLIGEFLDRRLAGEDLTPEDFVAEHPDIAEALRLSLQGLLLIDKARTLARDSAPGDIELAPPEVPAFEGYELIEKIGHGGMGVVYKALQVSTRRIVALKVMLGGPFASPSARRRFDREVQLAARLEHPSIVRILESGEVAGQRYFAMDYVSGVQLDDYLQVSQPDTRTILTRFVQLCEAVEYAHGHGVVHRDLKPANVLIDDEGNPHILDFGLAKATDQADTDEALTACVSLPGQVMGTLSYLSPEQAAGIPEEIDACTDVYTLGVLLFEALTGVLPLDTTGRPSQVIQRIQETPPTRPTSLSARVDGELETILLKALEKDKLRRYQSARELAQDLRRYLEGEPILAHRPSSLYVLRKKLRKHRWRVGLVAAATVLLLFVLVIRVTESRSRQRELNIARQNAARYTWMLHGGSRHPGGLQGLFERHSQLPEVRLLWALAQYQGEESRTWAILFLEDRLEHDRASWACRALLADIYQATGYAERADKLRAQAEQDMPDTPEAWYVRSYTTLDMEHAVRRARQAVQHCAASELECLAWQRLAHLCLAAGDLDGAMESANQFIMVASPGWPAGDREFWEKFKGDVFIRQGRVPEGIECYTRAGAYRHRAYAYRRLGEYSKAVADYTRVIEAIGRPVPVAYDLYQRATPLWILGRTEEALDDYRRVRILLGRPFYSDARQYLILCELGRQQEAGEVLTAALRDVKEDWLRQIFRCLAGELTPDGLVAAAAPGNLQQLCEAHYYAGEAYLLLGSHASAGECFERCAQTGLEFDPDAEPGTPMNEYELARWRLETLFPSTTPDSHP